ncbi:MAG: hypothetical protein IJ692_01775 [Alloprevotella sp.]|nr:hypothetical protein [Alloprevotella sp.]MBR1652101.1 hypothetical protein [Alloprevotella sp.]
MLYKIKFISDEVEGFLRELLIDSDSSFLDLAKAILDSCSYPDDQMTSFYVCDEDWERGQQVTREDMGGGAADEDCYVMGETRLGEFIEDEGQNFEFVFDPFSDRVFYLTVRELIPGKHLDKAEVVRSVGEAPKQIEELDFSLPPAAVKGAAVPDEEDDDLYGEGGAFNDDELDLEGFEIMDGSELY